jgi:hypothetical protein
VQRTASCFIQSATTGFTAKGFLSHYRVSPKEAFKGPEPDDGKPSRPVLRGPAPSNGGWLLGSSVIEMLRQLGVTARTRPSARRASNDLLELPNCFQGPFKVRTKLLLSNDCFPCRM